MTREDWLNKAIVELRNGLFKDKGYKVPDVRVSVGFTFRGGLKHIGEHWSPDASTDKKGAIFIHPTLDESVAVLDTLTHELVHAAVGNKEGHGPVFRKCALAIGLTGKMRSTVAGPELKITLEKLAKKLGDYPHAKLNPSKAPRKKQTTRMLKMECPDCGYIARASLTAIIQHGPVICPCNKKDMIVDIPVED